MSPQLLQTLSQIAIAAGLLLAAVGGYGAYHFGKKVDDIRDQVTDTKQDAIHSDVGLVLKGNESLQKSLEPLSSLVPLKLTAQQQQVITAAVQVAPHRSISVTATMGDRYAFELAQQLMAAITAGGWKVDGINQAVFDKALQGIVISVGRQPPPAAANDLFQALSRAGLSVTGNLDPNVKDETVSLWVGGK
jgi:hypothetical protein